MVKNWWNVLSMEGVTVCGHLGEGDDPCTDHSTSLETIANVP